MKHLQYVDGVTYIVEGWLPDGCPGTNDIAKVRAAMVENTARAGTVYDGAGQRLSLTKDPDLMTTAERRALLDTGSEYWRIVLSETKVGAA